MSKHYKKLILLLIPACAGFCLALALGSAEEPPELCHLCQNKALVRDAILACGDDPYAANLPEQFDPNYIQLSPWSFLDNAIVPLQPYEFALRHTSENGYWFKHIIAEGDMVAVLSAYATPDDVAYGVTTLQFGIFRISNGKILWAWIGPDWIEPWRPYEYIGE